MTLELLDREARLLVERLRLWTPARWAAAGRADTVRHLVQWCADAAADAERQPRRPVPLLADLALPDQLAVTSHDLVQAQPAEAGRAVAHLLTHRRELLGDPVPPAVIARLGYPDEAALLAAGRSAC